MPNPGLFAGRAPPEPELPPELKVVSRTPAKNLQLSMPPDPLRLTYSDFRNSLSCLGSPNRHERLPADNRVKQLFGKQIGLVFVQVEVIDQLPCERSINHHRIGVVPAVQKVDGPGKEPITEARDDVVIIALCVAKIAGSDDQVVPLRHLLQQLRNRCNRTIDVGTDTKDDVAGYHR